jgi:hypothetical protein
MITTQIFEFARIWIYSENRKTNQMPLGWIHHGPARGLLAQWCSWPTGHAGHGPLLCSLAAHSGGARVLSGGDFIDVGGLSTHSAWRRLRRSTGSAASSPGRRSRGAAVRWPVMRRSAAWLDGDSRRRGDLRRRKRAVSSGRLGVKTRRRSGLPEQR